MRSKKIPFTLHNLTDHPEDQEKWLTPRGIRSVPVLLIDGGEALVGYQPDKMLKLVGDPSKVTAVRDRYWMADKYQRIFDIALTTVKQLSPSDLETHIPERRQPVKGLVLHLMSAAEVAMNTHKTGSMQLSELAAASGKTKAYNTQAQIVAYGEQVQSELTTFLRKGRPEDIARVVSSHYGGIVPVEQVLYIIIGHTAHHLRQTQWFMENKLGITVKDKLGDKDMDGVIMPMELF